jgi:hypothetical protein
MPMMSRSRNSLAQGSRSIRFGATGSLTRVSLGLQSFALQILALS